MTFNNTTTPNVFYPIANAEASSAPFVDAFMNRDPTLNDIQYPIQKKWLNTSTGAFWELQNFNTVSGVTTATWVLLSKNTANAQTLTGNTGGAVPPTNNNINVVGDGVNITVTGNPATSTLTISPLGDLATTYVENTGSAVPAAGILNVLGSTGITTTGSGNTITITPTNGNPLVGNTVDAHTAPGTNPVVPNSSGLITVTGGQVAAGTTTNVIRTDSLAENTYTIEVQRSQAAASSTIGDNGVSHFDSAYFTVDANGFVSIAASQSPAFSAYLNTGVSGVTGDGTDYPIIFDTVNFDNLGNYSTSTGLFTAPKTGFYIFTTNVSFANLGAGHNQGIVDLNVNGALRIHGNTGNAIAQSSAGQLTWLATSVCHLTSGQTMNVITEVGGSTKTVNLQGAASFPGTQPTLFSGAFLF